MPLLTGRHGHRTLSAGLLLICLIGMAAYAQTKSDPLCPHIVACEYEAPAFTIRVVDKQTGQPLAGIHGIATWIAYGGPRRRWPLMVLEAVSGPDGQLTFPAWGPARSGTEGVLPGYDPMISLFLPGYRAQLDPQRHPIRTTSYGSCAPLRSSRTDLCNWFLSRALRPK